jgi:hypothetical protein
MPRTTGEGFNRICCWAKTKYVGSDDLLVPAPPLGPFLIPVENTNKTLKKCVRGLRHGGPCWGNARYRPLLAKRAPSPQACRYTPRQDRRRPTPRIYAAGTSEASVSAGAPTEEDTASAKTRRRYAAARITFPLSSVYSPEAKRHHLHRFWVGFGVMCPSEHTWLG